MAIENQAHVIARSDIRRNGVSVVLQNDKGIVMNVTNRFWGGISYQLLFTSSAKSANGYPVIVHDVDESQIMSV